VDAVHKILRGLLLSHQPAHEVDPQASSTYAHEEADTDYAFGWMVTERESANAVCLLSECVHLKFFLLRLHDGFR
jgi:hypothetical protein